jgi:hypothetical protein
MPTPSGLPEHVRDSLWCAEEYEHGAGVIVRLLCIVCRERGTLLPVDYCAPNVVHSSPRAEINEIRQATSPI